MFRSSGQAKGGKSLVLHDSFFLSSSTGHWKGKHMAAPSGSLGATRGSAKYPSSLLQV